jgi:hypothetical protein
MIIPAAVSYLILRGISIINPQGVFEKKYPLSAAMHLLLAFDKEFILPPSKRFPTPLN